MKDQGQPRMSTLCCRIFAYQKQNKVAATHYLPGYLAWTENKRNKNFFDQS